MDSTATESTTSWKVYSCHSTYRYAWNCRSSRPWVLSSIIGLMRSGFLSRSQSRLLFQEAGLILASLNTSGSNACFPPHLVVAKWHENFVSLSTRCCTEWRVGCPTMASSGTASILPLTILVAAVTVVVIVATVSALVRYKE